MKPTIIIYKNGFTAKMHNRRIQFIQGDEANYIKFVKLDKDNPGSNRDKIKITELYLSHEAMNVFFEGYNRFMNLTKF
jgi:hypothetical protein